MFQLRKPPVGIQISQLRKTEISELVNLIDIASQTGVWNDARVGHKATLDRNIRDTELCPVSGNPNFEAQDKLCYEIFHREGGKYVRDYKIDHLQLFDEGYHLLRYHPGGHYAEHYDFMFNAPNAVRIFTGIIFLNDAFVGGELVFTHFNYKIRPRPGTVVFFPSNFVYRHTAKPIKSGTKYSLVAFFVEPAPSPSKD